MKLIQSLLFSFICVPVALSAAEFKTIPDPDPNSTSTTKAVFIDSKTKEPLAGVTVMIKNLTDGTIMRVKTNARGEVNITSSINADFEIVGEKTGYKKLETKTNVGQKSQYFTLTKEQAVYHPFIRFK